MLPYVLIATNGKKRSAPVDVDDDDDVILVSDTPFEPSAKRLKTSHAVELEVSKEDKALEEEGFVIME